MKKLQLAAKQNVREREYWCEKLSEMPEKACFPYNNKLNHKKAAGGPVTREEIRYIVPDAEAAVIQKLSGWSDYNVNAILQTGLTALLQKYTGMDDIIVGAPIYRQTVEGEFINTVLPLRNRLKEGMTFKELLIQVSGTIVEATEHYRYPMEILVEQLQIPNESNGDFPLFEIMILLENIHDQEYIRGIQTGMQFHFSKQDTALEGKIEYDPERCDRSMIEQVKNHYITLLKNALADIHRPLSEIDILSEEEKQRLIIDFNAVGNQKTMQKTLHSVFEDQVEKTPDRIALEYKQQRLTYRQFNRESNRLAHYLRRKGVQKDQLVGLTMNRSPRMMTAIMGILKSGGAYLPIEPGTPVKRLTAMLEDGNSPLLLTENREVERYTVTELKKLGGRKYPVNLTSPRPQILELDRLPMLDRTLVDYEKYHKYIGQAMVKHSITFQATRGCPYQCAYCFKIWPKKHVVRSAENLFEEVKCYYDMGVRRFVFIDDIFNFDRENSMRFFETVLRHKMDAQYIFPSGFRGDILTPDFIDLAVEAGIFGFTLALETASPRLQKLIKKYLKLDKFRENIEYITKHHPDIILELQTMHGLPTETEEEAMMTLDFIKSIQWFDFPYINILKIFPNTEMERLALANGVKPEAIARSVHMAYHELPDTLPFDKSFTKAYQGSFLNDYFLSTERLKKVLPRQMKKMTEDEILQKYNSYLPVGVGSLEELKKAVKIDGEDIGQTECFDEARVAVPGLNAKIKERFPEKPVNDDALKVLLLDISLFFSGEVSMLYDVIEPPLGLMYLLTYLNSQLGPGVTGKIAKSRIDFDSFEEMRELLDQYKPDVIGIRSMTFYSEFFHRSVALMRQWGYDVPLIAGGPYATSNYAALLQDGQVDLVVLGEGESTTAEVIKEIIKNNGKLPPAERLKEIPGLAYQAHKTGGNGIERKTGEIRHQNEILQMETLKHRLNNESAENPEPLKGGDGLAYSIFTSGSTGKPKGILTTHANVQRVVKETNYVNVNGKDRVLQLSNYAFDGSVFDIYGALLNGSTLILLEKNDTHDLDKLAEIITGKQITVFFVTTALFNTLVELKPDSLINIRKILFGGERVSVKHTARALGKMGKGKIHHMYGPTETTVYATSYQIDTIDEAQATIPIGKPLTDTTIYVLDQEQKPVPPGVAGQVCIGGGGVARGYLNNPELTAEKFIPSPFRQGEIIYQSGDRGRWDPEGNIEFVGRIDQQVKIRGFRIEPGEIERRLIEQEHVGEAIVQVRQSKDGERYLCAYIVPAMEQPQPAEIKEKLLRELPEYMIPAKIVSLEKMPLTPNGKVDQKALPDPEGLVLAAVRQAPRDHVERKLAQIWAEVLGEKEEHIGSDSDFFEMGGHSLKATILLSKLHKDFQVRVPLADLFKYPTIKEQALSIKKLAKERFNTVEPLEEKEFYPMSSAQKRLYVLNRLDNSRTNYNITAILQAEGTMDEARMKEALEQLVQRHQSLRTTFRMMENEPVQRIHPDVRLTLQTFDGTGSEKGDGNEDIENIINEFVRPFELTEPPLMRVGLIKQEERKQIIMFDVHHIVMDGTSMGIFIAEFMALYAGRELTEQRIQYKDYSEWRNRNRDSEAIKKQEQYWLEKFARQIPELKLPQDYPRPREQGYEGGRYNIRLTAEETAALKAVAQQQDATLYMVLQVIYNVMLHKMSGQEDIVVGMPTAGRGHADIQGTVGMFLDTQVLRTEPTGDKTVKQYLGEVKHAVLEAFENQDYQFEELVEALEVKRDTGRNPVFDVMFLLENQEMPELEIPGLTLKVLPRETDSTKFDLGLYAMEIDGQLECTFNYRTTLYKPETIRRFAGYYKQIAAAVLENPGQKISEIQLNTPLEQTERRQAAARDLRREAEPMMNGRRTIQEMYAASREKNRKKTAVEKGARKLTYEQLDEAANRLAAGLKDAGIEPGTHIGLRLEDRCTMIAAIIAVLKTGGVFVPLDPQHPEERIRTMIQTTETRIVLTDGNQNPTDREDVRYIRVRDIENRDKNAGCGGETGPAVRLNPLDKVYIYFTSGTTGQPRAIVGKNESLAHFIAWEIEEFVSGEQQPGVRVSQLTNVGFDAFLRDVFVPLCSGGTVCIPESPETLREPETLAHWITDNRINIIHTVPSYFRQLTAAEITGDSFGELRYVLLSGEKIYPSYLEKWYGVFGDRKPLVNFYGPTETTMIKTVYRIPAGDRAGEWISIGRPMTGCEVILLNEAGKICAPLEVGELNIRTPYTTYGYYNEPQLNGQRFVQNPYSEDPEDRLYRTGDMGRLLPDGRLQLIGRKDRQVKINGIRIEQEEIEKEHRKHPEVKDAAVLTVEQDEGNLRLAAFIVLETPAKEQQDAPAAVERIKEHMSKRLPIYMVPTQYEIIEELPKKISRKIDYQALDARLREKETAYEAPIDSLENKLAEIWTETLGHTVTEIGVTANYFELGGNSLNIMALSNRIHRELGVKLPLKQLFQKPEIRLQAQYIRQSGRNRYSVIPAVEKKEYYVLSSVQKRLYIMQQLQDRESIAYNISQVVNLEGELDRDRFREAMRAVIRRHESFRTSFHVSADEPVQKIWDDVELDVEYYDYARLQEVGETENEIIEDFIRPFDLSKTPLLRVGVIEKSARENILMLDMHHIISDGVSTAIIMEDFMAYYRGETIEPQRIHYKDYAEWQHRQSGGEEMEKRREYWISRFKDGVPRLELPVDYARTEIQSFEGDTSHWEITKEETTQLKQIAQQNGMTVYTVLLTIYSVLLSKICNREQQVIGTVTAGRDRAEQERIVGMFVNTLALRLNVDGEQTFTGYLKEVAEESLEAFENQDYPMEKLVEEVVGKRDASRNPLFDVTFTFQNIELKQFDIPGLSIRPHSYENKIAKFDMQFVVIDGEDRLYSRFEYCTKLFKQETIQRIIESFKSIMTEIIKDPGIKISAIQATSEIERKEIEMQFVEDLENEL